MEMKIGPSYIEYLRDLNLQRARVACLLGSSLLIGSSVLDAYMQPEYFGKFLLIRVIGAILVLITYGFSFSSYGKKNGLLLGMLVVFIISTTLSIIIHNLGYESPYYAGLNLIILAIGVLFTWEFYQALIASIGVYLMYLLPILVLGEIVDFKIFVNNNLFILETIIIAVAASYFSSNLRKRDFESRHRLADSVKELKSTQAQLVHSAKLASVGELAAGVAHELNNSLDIAILANIKIKKMLKKAGEKEELKWFLDETKRGFGNLNEGLARAQNVVRNLLTFSKKDSEGFHHQDIHEGIESSIMVMGNEAKDRVEIHKDFCEVGAVFCDLNQLNQVFLNMFKNAVDAIEEKGDLWIRTWLEGDNINISIRDNGMGIAEDKLDKIFDPFFTTKDVGEGTGLGLSVSYNIVRDHKGVLKCVSTVGEGTEFIITMPIDSSKKG